MYLGYRFLNDFKPIKNLLQEIMSLSRIKVAVGKCGAMAKWLRQWFAKPLFPGSNPGGASNFVWGY